MKIALVGIGKIARDQHIPALRASPDWELAAAVSRHSVVGRVETFATLGAMQAARPDIDVVSLSLPPAPRYEFAVAALKAGKHVMLEKPPAASLAEARCPKDLPASFNRTLFASWHSRMAPAVAPAKAWLTDKTIKRAKVVWRENVRKWHPGQAWIFETGGMGVFDTGINGLSILTEILPFPVELQSANLYIPENRAMPIAARLELSCNISVELDWRQAADEIWTISIETTMGSLQLRNGGHEMLVDGPPAVLAKTVQDEYPALYARFAELVRAGKSDVDLGPLEIVEDAFAKGKRTTVEAFEFCAADGHSSDD